MQVTYYEHSQNKTLLASITKSNHMFYCLSHQWDYSGSQRFEPLTDSPISGINFDAISWN